ncbi:hypothetical protein L873DRAFT_1798186 [Choiromyces venosus 120613-1]|uniref:Pentacotripeptide-repeat region of PRORP domain-containing protein n=1 Tax=Choiromyces venosus 120613-1 TaxID=1336337 RepID=A0A3N4K9T3_9PEZI|nr:hypothetical protein L873DRAFT_1798186 [Choiromyces venosus 120613-1]
MMIPHTHAIAPSKNALHYLRQILFHWPCEPFHHGPIANCIRLNVRRKNSNCSQQVKARSPEALKKRRNPTRPETPPSSPPNVSLTKPVSKSVSRRHQLISQRTSVQKAATATTNTPTTTSANSSIALPIQDKIKSASSRVWVLKCCRSILEGKLSEARVGFLEGLQRGEYGEQVKIVGKAVMKALRKRGRHSEIPDIFHRMYIAGQKHVDTHALNICLEAYIEMGMYSKVISTYRYHRPRVQPDIQTMKHRLRNFIAMRKLHQAEKLLRGLLKKEGPPWMADSAMFALLLGGVKIISGSFHRMERIFKWMAESRVKLHVGVFNVLIEAAINVGRLDIAKGYARVKLELGIKHNAETYAIFLAAYARRQNWQGTASVLKEMELKKVQLTTPMFNMLLKTYSTTIGLEDLKKFFDKMEVRGILPDSYSYNIMIHSCVRQWDEPGIEHWVRRMMRSGIGPDAVTLNTLFQTIRHTGDAVPFLLRRIYAIIRENNDSLINQRTKDMLVHSTYRGLERVRIRPSQEIVDQSGEELAIDQALQQDQPTTAIDIFQRHLSRGIKPSIPLVTSAVRATLSLPRSSLSEAYRLLRICEDRGIKISKTPTLKSFEILLPPRNTDPTEAYITVSSQIREAYTFLESAELPITHDISVHTAWRLTQEKNPRAAVLLLHEISKTRWGTNFPWEKKSLTVLMKAYIDIGDTAGLGWIVDQLIAGGEVPDNTVFKYLMLAMDAAATGQEKSFVQWSEAKCSQHRLAMRDEAKRRIQFLWYLAKDWKKS